MHGGSGGELRRRTVRRDNARHREPVGRARRHEVVVKGACRADRGGIVALGGGSERGSGDGWRQWWGRGRVTNVWGEPGSLRVQVRSAVQRMGGVAGSDASVAGSHAGAPAGRVLHKWGGVWRLRAAKGGGVGDGGGGA